MIPEPVKTNNPDNLVFLDIETTGLSMGQGARICEIAMLKVSSGIETSYSKLINPNQHIPQSCSQIHGITDDMVKDCPKFSEVAQEVADFIKGYILVCHNASFDLNFVSKEIMENKIRPAEMYFLDTLIIARQYFSFASNKLGELANILDIEVKQHHRAMADVLTMQAVSKYLFSNLYRKGIESLEPKYFEQSLTFPK